jgi:hypothetical protein
MGVCIMKEEGRRKKEEGRSLYMGFNTSTQNERPLSCWGIKALHRIDKNL